LRIDAFVDGRAIGQQIANFDVPEFAPDDISQRVTFRDGVGELEPRANSDEPTHLEHGIVQDLVGYMDSTGDVQGTNTSMYWVVNPSTRL
jgi:hypothetical protein